MRQAEDLPCISFFLCDGEEFVKVPVNTWLQCISSLNYYGKYDTEKLLGDKGAIARYAMAMIKRDILAKVDL